MSKSECLQSATGSCAGCNIIKIARNLAASRGETPRSEGEADQIVQEVAGEYCPADSRIQVRLVARPSQSNW